MACFRLKLQFEGLLGMRYLKSFFLYLLVLR